MQLIFLGIVFLVIILMLAKRRPLYEAIFGGLVVTVVLFRISPKEIVNQVLKVFTNWSSLSVLISLYIITLLQRLLGARDQIKMAQKDLNGLFHNRRINAAVAPVFIGLVPCAAAMILCGDIVKEASDGYLEKKEQAFVTSWFRHLPESILPTYSGVILMTTLSGVPVSEFIVGMIIPGIVLAILGYWPYLHRLPVDPGTPKSENRLKDAVNLFCHLWTILLILVLILGCGLGVVPAVLVTIVLAIFVYRFKPAELVDSAKSAFEFKLLMNSFLVLVLYRNSGDTSGHAFCASDSGISGICVAVFCRNYGQWNKRNHRTWHTAGVCGDGWRHAVNGTSYVYVPCGQPDFTDSCMPDYCF